jgi:hypothetical protein
MATITDEQVSDIIKNNPNKDLIKCAQTYSNTLSLHVLGKGLSDAMSRNEYFESDDVFKVRNKNATSNKDLFERILSREQMVFTAKGGSSFYTGINEQQTQKLDARLDKIRFNMNIRKWINEFGLQAYRVDPMGVFFIEVDNKSNSYPTYKSSDCVFDYQPNGRKLEYICFKLKNAEVAQFLTQAGQSVTNDSDLQRRVDKYNPQYFRFIDDKDDRIVKNNGTSVEIIHSIPIAFDELPGIRVSDLIDFSEPSQLLSPLDKVIELASTFLQDRSIRDLSKKFSGFPKSYEPLMTCGTCNGTTMLSGKACPDCTPLGADRGTGKKLKTTVADVARFPLPKEGQVGSFDPAKYFGYITPPIDTWNKQDTSLNDIEAEMTDTYWGTNDKQSTTGPTVGAKHSFKETATKTLNDLKPVYTRLNKTADWAEGTENALCAYIGKQMFKSFKNCSRTYGRYYILETPDELMEQYLDMKTKGAPQTALFDILRKYYHALYQDDPIELSIKLKLIDVEPFVHLTLVQVQASNPARIDFYMKMYYSEWLAMKDNTYLLVTKTEALIADLVTYSKTKMVAPADSLVPPTVGITETIRNTN